MNVTLDCMILKRTKSPLNFRKSCFILQFLGKVVQSSLLSIHKPLDENFCQSSAFTQAIIFSIPHL